MSELVEVEIPFDGFYCSHHDDNITRAIESGFDYNYDTDEDQEVPDSIWEADINYASIHKEYCKKYAERVGEELGLHLTFKEMISPREYNFSTDRIFCDIPKEQINKIRKEVEAHEDYPKYIKEEFSHRDGFWSFYSSDYKDEDWTKDILDPCQYLAIFNFWLDKITTEVSDWHDTETYIMDDLEMYNWDSITEAHETIDKHLKEKNESNIDTTGDNSRVSLGV